MNYIERAIETSMRHVCISSPSDPAARGLTRENAVIAITGAFGISSKTIIQRHLGLNRESVNKLINRLKKKGLFQYTRPLLILTAVLSYSRRLGLEKQNFF